VKFHFKKYLYEVKGGENSWLDISGIKAKKIILLVKVVQETVQKKHILEKCIRKALSSYGRHSLFFFLFLIYMIAVHHFCLFMQS